MTYRSVSLKVCEGCGTLWIRGGAGTGVYCGPCTQILQQFPDPKTRLRPGRPTKQRVERSYGNAAVVDGGEEQQVRLDRSKQEGPAEDAALVEEEAVFGQQFLHYAPDEALSQEDGLLAQDDGLWGHGEECGFVGDLAVSARSSAAVVNGGAA